jgi:hypothetical protein
MRNGLDARFEVCAEYRGRNTVQAQRRQLPLRARCHRVTRSPAGYVTEGASSRMRASPRISSSLRERA